MDKILEFINDNWAAIVAFFDKIWAFVMDEAKKGTWD